MLLVPIPWAGRVWALPFLTALAPSERYCRERGRRHKKLTDWARQLVLQARRWMPGRPLVAGGRQQLRRSRVPGRPASGRTSPASPACGSTPPSTQPAPPRQPGTIGRPRTKGERLPTLAEVLADTATRWQRVTVPGWYGEGERVVEICSDTAVWRHSGLPVVPIRWVLLRDPSRRFDPQALLCTDLAQEPLQIIRWFVQRWQLEVTFREVRDHLGVETQRQWSDKAIARTTPCLLGLFSVVTLLAHRLGRHARLRVSAATPGTTSSGRPSPTPSPRYGGRSGGSRVSSSPGGGQDTKTPPRPPRGHRPCALPRRITGSGCSATTIVTGTVRQVGRWLQA